jgi:hypothetical protein
MRTPAERSRSRITKISRHKDYTMSLTIASERDTGLRNFCVQSAQFLGAWIQVDKSNLLGDGQDRLDLNVHVRRRHDSLLARSASTRLDGRMEKSGGSSKQT